MSENLRENDWATDQPSNDTDVDTGPDTDIDPDIGREVDDNPDADITSDLRYLEPIGPGDKEAARWNTELRSIKAQAEGQFSEQVDNPDDQAQNALDEDIMPSDQSTDPLDNKVTTANPTLPDLVNRALNPSANRVSTLSLRR